MHIWDEFENEDNHLILTGDFIHAMGLEMIDPWRYWNTLNSYAKISPTYTCSWETMNGPPYPRKCFLKRV